MEKILGEQTNYSIAEKKERKEKALNKLKHDASGYSLKNREEILELISFDESLIMSPTFQEAAKDAIIINMGKGLIDEARIIAKDFNLLKS